MVSENLRVRISSIYEFAVNGYPWVPPLDPPSHAHKNAPQSISYFSVGKTRCEQKREQGMQRIGNTGKNARMIVVALMPPEREAVSLRSQGDDDLPASTMGTCRKHTIISRIGVCIG